MSGRTARNHAIEASSAAAARRCSQAQSSGEYKSRPTKLSGVA
jgi:hypothetical protein